LEKFRIIKDKLEVLQLINNSPEGEFRGEIWQTHKNNRLHYKIQKITDDSENKIIVFMLDQRINFNSHEDVFVRVFHRDLIFKLESRAYVFSGKKLASPYPDTAKAIESRGMSRILMPEKMDVQVMLKPLGESAVSLNVQLFDISRGGLGILISELNRDYLIRNNVFKIIKINDIDLMGHNEVAVGYTKSLSKGLVKSGLIWKTPLVERIFDYICKGIFSQNKS
jgi:hypothetical protein